MQLWFLVYSSWGPKSKSNNNNQVKNALHTHINLNRETTTTTQGELFKQKRTNSNSLKKIVSHEARSWFTNSVSLSLSFCVSLSVSASTPSPTPTPQAHWTRTCRWRRGRVRRTLAWRSPSLWCTPRAGCWPVRSPAASCSRCSWRTSTRQARTSTSTTCRGVGAELLVPPQVRLESHYTVRRGPTQDLKNSFMLSCASLVSIFCHLLSVEL